MSPARRRWKVSLKYWATDPSGVVFPDVASVEAGARRGSLQGRGAFEAVMVQWQDRGTAFYSFFFAVVKE